MSEIRRHPQLADAENMALVVVDIQERFAPAVTGFEEIVKNSVTLIKGFQVFGVPILVTEQYPKGLGKTVPEVAESLENSPVIEKLTFSCAQEQAFFARLSDLKAQKVVVCGIEAHVCMHQTVHDLLHNGYQVFVPVDATGSRAPHNKQIALARMKQAGAILTSTEMILFEMAFEAGTESFKRIQKLVK